ncbi:TfoX/Sxy family protein [Oceanibacterium hippocampi]|uniref:TfoX N-terminal domain-containing protein n=1 Tax=Oceanibacterium hippocampi TaxID=745714 RepID=A0A1Y5T6V9_9PROT|nr:TfoX/Sxy family protein [Oceanibacterium hippocampi]SLN56750.1 hypothetical protein OCH7691_02474 [Oceanibacterium hippocampi]
MAYDEEAAGRVRRCLSAIEGVTEIRMMGGLVFCVNGHMCCGVTGPALMVRVGPDRHAGALAEPSVRPLDIGGGRRPRAFVCVDPAGYADDAALAAWVGRGLAFVGSLAPKKTRQPKKRKPGTGG